MIQYQDKQLILELQDGDLAALGNLYDRHRNLVYRTALAITGDPEEASDLLQDVFLRLYRFADRIDSDRPIEPWLYRMTTNMAYTLVKRQSRWLHVVKKLADRLSREKKENPLQQIEFKEEWQVVQQALNSLTVEKRVVVALYYINDLSLQEISETLDLPIGTVKSRLHYGRQALKKYLGLDQQYLPEAQYETN